MSKLFNVAVVGATGAVGEVLIELLEERNFPVDNLYLLASTKSVGKAYTFKDKSVRVKNLDTFDFSQVQIAFFSAGGHVSKQYVPKATAANCIVIDNTSEFRYNDDVPLIIPEVNAHRLGDYKKTNIIANPNCSTIQMLVALHAIHKAVGITRINVATYQAVSGSGQKAIKELASQTMALLGGQDIIHEAYPIQIAFNVIPQIDEFQENGYTREEMKMVWETQKILEDDSIKVNPTAVRVPVFYGHSEAIHIETKQKITAQKAKELLSQSAGVTLKDTREAAGYPSPVIDAVGKDDVFVGRIREDISHENGLNLWVVSDNIRKGAALNSIQIAEKVATDYL
jgi:aspartate-semialdehyde dehydrogenase